MLEEGGYYAIKGFSYQYIISLIEIFKCNDSKKVFSFESIQDFNTEEVIYQMKYKETQKFSNSKIKEPTLKIFEQFKTIKKDYILYVYFNDKENEKLVFNSIEELDKVLLNCKIGDKLFTFTKEEKENFIKHYKVIFSKNYFFKSDELLQNIKNELSVSFESAEIYLFSLVGFIINLISNNEAKNRKITKSELITFLKNKSSEIFRDFFFKNKEKEKYLKFIRKEFFFERNINNHNRLFIINLESNKIDDYYECITTIVKKYYLLNKKRTMIISKAPYIYIPRVSEDLLVKLKTKLNADFLMTDGYRFYKSPFDLNYITKNFSARENLSCKIINNEIDLKKVIIELKEAGIKIFEFYDDYNEIKGTNNSISIRVEKIDDIGKMIR